MTKRALEGDRLDRFLALSAELTTPELMEEFQISRNAVNTYLNEHEVKSANYCFQCKGNRPGREFEGPYNTSMCNRHTPIIPRQRKGVTSRSRQKDTEAQRNEENSQYALQAREIISCWIATPEGAPNGYAGQFSEVA